MKTEGSLSYLQEPTTCRNPEPVLSLHALPPHFLKIHFSIFLPSIPTSSKWCASLKFPHQNRLLYTCQMPIWERGEVGE
jgi:hypothetical protein